MELQEEIKTARRLEADEIRRLEAAGCVCADWSRVRVCGPIPEGRIRNVTFVGDVRIGRLDGCIRTLDGHEKPCGLYDATLANVTIGDGVRIARVRVHLADYRIESGVCIEDIGLMQTRPGARFGNGVSVAVGNEAGGREVILYDGLSAQVAYMVCRHRYRPDVVARLQTLARDQARRVRSDRGCVGTAAQIRSVDRIIDVRIGPGAVVDGAARLINGTILSLPDASTYVGTGVDAEDFIIAENARVEAGPMLRRVYVGQGTRIGKQFSAEDCLFFANCEAFHGEAVAVFAGPYTVTHHKSTLLIAGTFSFYNAGSGTNQSNHMYKLGPCHEGQVLRGSKTGSFSYMMWPCVVGPFSVVLGKHTSTFDTGDYPFSHLEARSDGKCQCVPGLHLTTVGTVRDRIKWPQRDRRPAGLWRDLITFDVLSPYTVERMIRAHESLRTLLEKTPREVQEVSVGGTLVRRLLLRTCCKYYQNGVHVYLLDKVIERLERGLGNGSEPAGELHEILAVEPEAVYSEQWVDIGGLLMGRKRLDALHEAIADGTIGSIKDLDQALACVQKRYEADTWAWVTMACKRALGMDLQQLSGRAWWKLIRQWAEAKCRFLTLVAADAEKEFAESARCGFGHDGDAKDAVTDFEQVRGSAETNAFIRELRETIEQVRGRAEQIENRLGQILKD